MSNHALLLVEKIFSLYEESTSPVPCEVRDDMLAQIHAMLPRLAPGEAQEFSEFVQWMGGKMLSYVGTTEDILQRLQPWALQIILQRFKIPAMSPKA
jgi:hypothetical protein